MIRYALVLSHLQWLATKVNIHNTRWCAKFASTHYHHRRQNIFDISGPVGYELARRLLHRHSEKSEAEHAKWISTSATMCSTQTVRQGTKRAWHQDCRQWRCLFCTRHAETQVKPNKHLVAPPCPYKNGICKASTFVGDDTKHTQYVPTPGGGLSPRPVLIAVSFRLTLQCPDGPIEEYCSFARRKVEGICATPLFVRYKGRGPPWACSSTRW